MPDRVILDDSELAIPAFSPVCTYCAHWEPEKTRQCAAYPRLKAIPMVVWEGRSTHTTPRGDEQHDASGQPIVFTPVKGAKLPAELKHAYDER